MTSLATHEDYELRIGETLDSTKRGQVDVLLDEASEFMRAFSPGLDDRIGVAGGIAEVLVKGIACDMVQRYLANPTRAIQLGSGPFIRGYSSATARGMYLTDEEQELLNPPATGGLPNGIGSIRLGVTVRPRRCR